MPSPTASRTPRPSQKRSITDLTIDIPGSNARTDVPVQPSRWRTTEFKFYGLVFALVVPLLYYWPMRLSSSASGGLSVSKWSAYSQLNMSTTGVIEIDYPQAGSLAVKSCVSSCLPAPALGLADSPLTPGQQRRTIPYIQIQLLPPHRPLFSTYHTFRHLHTFVAISKSPSDIHRCLCHAQARRSARCLHYKDLRYPVHQPPPCQSTQVAASRPDVALRFDNR